MYLLKRTRSINEQQQAGKLGVDTSASVTVPKPRAERALHQQRGSYNLNT